MLPEEVLAVEADSAYPRGIPTDKQQTDRFFPRSDLYRPWDRTLVVLPGPQPAFLSFGKTLFSQAGPSGCPWSCPSRDHGSVASIHYLPLPIKVPGLLQSMAQPQLCPLVGAEERGTGRKGECVGLGLKMGTAKGVCGGSSSTHYNIHKVNAN